jgi:hypothetical protein
MRFEELATPADPSGSPTRFHRAMTVIGPMDQAARARWIHDVLAVLAGQPPTETDGATPRSITVADHQGQMVRIERVGREIRIVDPETGADITTDEGGQIAAELLSRLDLDATKAEALQVVRPADVAAAVPVAAPDHDASPEELVEARLVLSHVEAEHAEAVAAVERVAELKARRDHLDESLRRSHETKARRKYSAALVERERIQAELSAVLGENPVDEAAIESCAAVLDQLEEVASQSDRVAQRRTAFGNRRRLTSDGLEQALALPTDVPDDLPRLHEQYLDARLRRAELLERLDDTAVSDLPVPSEPWVLTLARINQLDLWERADRAIETRKRVAQLSVALGGAGKHRDLVSEIEAAHEQVDRAERTLYGIGRRPMLLALGGGVMAGAVAMFAPVAAAPFVGAAFWAEVRVWRTRRRLAIAEKVEQDVLEKAGFTSWLGFKLRWVETLIDVNARETLQIAELEDQLASTAWFEVAGDIAPEVALTKQEEIGRYAEHLNSLRSSTDASDAVRRELLEEVEPRYESARRTLLEVCAPFGVDPEHALSEVAALVFDARSARLQLELEVAEKDEERAVSEVVRLLGAAGEPPAGDLSDIDERLGAVGQRYQQLLAAVEAVAAAQEDARPEAEIRAELSRMDEVIARFERAGITSTVTEGELDGRDPREIQRDLHDVAVDLDAAERQVPDVDRIADRLDGLRRRVKMLETGTGEALAVPEPKELEMYLLGRVASARRVGPGGEPVPLIIDDVLRTLPKLQKHRLLDLLARLGDAAQIVYLSLDDETIEWARTRSGSGAAAYVSTARATPTITPASAPAPAEPAGSIA